MFLQLDPTSTEHHVFHWPLAPGEWWSPNFAAGGRMPEQDRWDWAPGDLVQVHVSPQVKLLKRMRDNKGNMHYGRELQGPPYLYRISFWGGDDTYMEQESGVYWTAEQVTRFFLDLPNPVTSEYLRNKGFGLW